MIKIIATGSAAALIMPLCSDGTDATNCKAIRAAQHDENLKQVTNAITIIDTKL